MWVLLLCLVSFILYKVCEIHSVSFNMSVVYSLLLTTISFPKYITMDLSVHLLMNIMVVSSARVL